MAERMGGPWSSLLQERAEHIRNVRMIALATRIDVVVDGLDELAILYGKAADRIPGANDRGPGVWRAPGCDPSRELIKRLEHKADLFRDQARAATDAGRAAQLRSLAAIFGAEAARFQAAA